MSTHKIAEIVLSKKDSKILVDEVLNPREPNDKLKEAAEKYREQWIRSMADAEDRCGGNVTAGDMTEYDANAGMPTVECKAAIFALNSLCDIEAIIYDAFNAALMEHGYSVPEERKADFAGMPIDLRLSILSEQDHLPAEYHAWISRRTEVFIRRTLEELTIDEQKIGLFQSLKKRDIKIAVYTTVTRDSLRLALTNLGIMGLVDAWLGTEDVELLPPDPAIFEKALEQLSVDAQSCVVVDSLYCGWIAAREKHFAMVVEIDSSKDVTEILF